MQVGIAEVDLGPSAAKVNALETERALAHLRQAEEAKKKNKAVLDGLSHSLHRPCNELWSDTLL